MVDRDARFVVVVLLLGAGVTSPALAQPSHFERYVVPMRARAVADGWAREEVVDGPRTDERWCPPPGPCSTDPSHDLFVVTTWGLSRSVEHRRTSADGWRVTASLGFWESNPPTFTLRFERGADVLEIAWELHSPPLSDGTYVSRTGGEDSGDFDAWLAAELPAYLVSADALRERVLLRSATMRAHLRLHAPSLSVCDDPDDPGRFTCVPTSGGHAMMDGCLRRTLTTAEVAAFLATAEAELDARDAIIRAHAPQLYVGLVALFRPTP